MLFRVLNVNQSAFAFILIVTACVGCASTSTSNTARTGTEQILISAAIDRAISNVEFSDFANYSVFINDKYLDSVDKGYLIGTLRHRVMEGGGRIATSVDTADLVLEPRSGGIGTDSQESFVGIPAIGIPGMPIELPEVKIANRSTQMGTAKIALICYDAKTGAAMSHGGEATALTHNNNTYVMGVGPFRSGSVLEQRERAIGFDGVGGSFLSNPIKKTLPPQIAMVDDSNEAPYSVAPDIATVPTETLK